MKTLNVLIHVLTYEKMLQHLLTAVFFVVDVPGIGTPSIGAHFHFGAATMTVLNIAYFVLFGIGIARHAQKRRSGTRLIIVLAVADIVLEFMFHGLFYITVSVIVSTLLTLIATIYLKKTYLAA